MAATPRVPGGPAGRTPVASGPGRSPSGLNPSGTLGDLRGCPRGGSRSAKLWAEAKPEDAGVNAHSPPAPAPAATRGDAHSFPRPHPEHPPRPSARDLDSPLPRPLASAVTMATAHPCALAPPRALRFRLRAWVKVARCEPRESGRKIRRNPST